MVEHGSGGPARSGWSVRPLGLSGREARPKISPQGLVLWGLKGRAQRVEDVLVRGVDYQPRGDFAREADDRLQVEIARHSALAFGAFNASESLPLYFGLLLLAEFHEQTRPAACTGVRSDLFPPDTVDLFKNQVAGEVSKGDLL